MLKHQKPEETQCESLNIQCKEQHFQYKELREPHPMLEAKAGPSSAAVLASLPCELNCL